MREGRQEALEATKRAIVEILRARFGDVPVDLAGRLDGRTQNQLTEIIVRSATAASPEAALGPSSPSRRRRGHQ